MKAVFLDEAVSTNDTLKQLALGTVEPFTFVYAENQTGGRGRMQRTWHSEKGASLTFSVLLPDHPYAFQLGLTGAYAAVSLLNRIYNVTCSIKWPNDIYHQHLKLGGVLTEKTGSYVIVGIGLNLNQEIFPGEIREKAVSLFQITGKKTAPRDLFNAMQTSILKTHTEWTAEPELFLKNRITPLLCWINRPVDIKSGSSILSGIYRGISKEGYILLETEGGLMPITSGEVSLCLQP